MATTPLVRTERRKTILRRVRQETTSENRDRSAPRPPEIDSIMLERPLSLVSLNVRDLRGDTPKPKEIKAWMASLSPPLKSYLYRSTTWAKKEFKAPGRRWNSGTEPHSEMKEFQWAGRKELVQEWRSSSIERPPRSSRIMTS
jgi:hypothetical protein